MCEQEAHLSAAVDQQRGLATRIKELEAALETAGFELGLTRERLQQTQYLQHLCESNKSAVAGLEASLDASLRDKEASLDASLSLRDKAAGEGGPAQDLQLSLSALYSSSHSRGAAAAAPGWLPASTAGSLAVPPISSYLFPHTPTRSLHSSHKGNGATSGLAAPLMFGGLPIYNASVLTAPGKFDPGLGTQVRPPAPCSHPFLPRPTPSPAPRGGQRTSPTFGLACTRSWSPGTSLVEPSALLRVTGKARRLSTTRQQRLSA